VKIDISGQQLLFDELAEQARPKAQNGADAVVFNRPDPHDIFFGGLRLQIHLQNMGVKRPFAVRKMLQAQNWSAFEALYSKNGRRPYAPDAMAGLILYGVMKGVSSLRGLEELARTDLGCMWVTGGILPDHSVIGRFILKHDNEFQGSFLAALTGSVLKLTGSDVEMVAGDGTVIQAVVSRYKTLRLEALEKKAQKAKEKSAEKPDDDKLKARAEELEAAREELEKRVEARREKGLSTDNTSIAPGEPDAVVQPQKNKSYAPSYKPSVLVNKARVVVGFDLHPSSEVPQIKEMHEQAELYGDILIALYDAGYNCFEALKIAEQRNFELLCPEGRTNRDGDYNKKSKKQFPKSSFKYDAETDTYECPAGEKLSRVSSGKASKNRPAFTIYGARVCGDCKLREQCTKAKNGRRISRYEGDAAKEALRAKMADPDTQKLYRKRAGMVEPVFSEMREKQGLNRFRRRGKAKVRLEFALHVAAYNLGRAAAWFLRLLYCFCRLFAPVRSAKRLFRPIRRPCAPETALFRQEIVCTQINTFHQHTA